VDHFALPQDELARARREGTLRRNFMGYTTQAGVDLIGFGPSAISELRRTYAQSKRELSAWQAAVSSGGLATLRGHALSGDDLERRWVIGRIMCQGEVSAREYEAEFGTSFTERFAPELERLVGLEADGLLSRGPDGVRLTLLGRVLVRNVAAVFDAYLPAQARTDHPIFSRTV
jgi:oxygen-independent coproporphyrinogen-3 oxidase